MKIPDQALEAAARSLVPALGDDVPRELSDIVVRLLEAAAPFIAAEAVRVASLASRGQHFPAAPDVTLWLDSIADRFERDEMEEA